MRVLLIVALLGEAAFACPAPRLTDVPITKDGTVIPPDGGVVMTTVNGADGGADGPFGTRLVAGTTDVVLRRDYLAPGLTVIVPKPQANRGIELVGSGGKAILKLTQGAVTPKHAAPKPAKVTSSLPPAKKNDVARVQMYAPSGQMTIELAEPAPDDVLALVMFTKLSGTQQGVAWVRPQKDQKAYTFYVGGKMCVPGPMGLPQGTTVTLGWVDLSGRVSVLSKDMRVVAPPPVKQPGRPALEPVANP